MLMYVLPPSTYIICIHDFRCPNFVQPKVGRYGGGTSREREAERVRRNKQAMQEVWELIDQSDLIDEASKRVRPTQVYTLKQCIRLLKLYRAEMERAGLRCWVPFPFGIMSLMIKWTSLASQTLCWTVSYLASHPTACPCMYLHSWLVCTRPS